MIAVYKNFFLMLGVTVLLCISASVVWSNTIDDLVYRGISPKGIWYKKFSDTPFTGKITGRVQTYIKEGKYEGVFKFYHSNGQLSIKSFFKNGVREGKYISYYENGVTLEKGIYKNNLKEGIWYVYYNNGKLSSKETYVKGKKEGYKEHFNVDGSIGIHTGTYKNDKKISN